MVSDLLKTKTMKTGSVQKHNNECMYTVCQLPEFVLNPVVIYKFVCISHFSMKVVNCPRI